MNYQEKFEDDGFVYELTVNSSAEKREHLHTLSQGEGYCCSWTIVGKKSNDIREVSVTDDNCELIVFRSVEDAVSAAKKFLEL